MSKSGYNERIERQRIINCQKDPQASDLGRTQETVTVNIDSSSVITFTHEPNPDAWITTDYWIDIEALGTKEYTQR